MKEYDVKITETLEKTVTVEAKSRADAEEQVRTAYYNSEYEQLLCRPPGNGSG